MDLLREYLWEVQRGAEQPLDDVVLDAVNTFNETDLKAALNYIDSHNMPENELVAYVKKFIKNNATVKEFLVTRLPKEKPITVIKITGKGIRECGDLLTGKKYTEETRKTIAKRVLVGVHNLGEILESGLRTKKWSKTVHLNDKKQKDGKVKNADDLFVDIGKQIRMFDVDVWVIVTLCWPTKGGEDYMKIVNPEGSATFPNKMLAFKVAVNGGVAEVDGVKLK
jgi:hypothetical protein